MGIMNAGQIKKLNKDEYTTACFFCGGSHNLKMFPHRKTGQVVGFIFSCCEVPENNELTLTKMENL